jgi:hypothetical protein
MALKSSIYEGATDQASAATVRVFYQPVDVVGLETFEKEHRLGGGRN